jgi:hypothetical protein
MWDPNEIRTGTPTELSPSFVSVRHRAIQPAVPTDFDWVNSVGVGLGQTL